MVNAWNVLLAAVAVAPRVLGMSKNGEFLMNAKESYWKAKVDAGEYPRLELESSRSAAAVCPENGGTVTINGEQFPCKGVDFQSFISLRELSLPGQGGTTLVSDIWGWLSPDNREITLLCLDNGVWFIDTTNPEAPVKLGNLPTGRPKFAWCDIKVYKNVAYIVKDGTDTTASRTYGIEVFDLNRLNGLTGATVQVFTPDFVYRQHGKSHNVAIDTESGFLYSVGSNTCSGGLHIINLEPNPLRPAFSVCVSSDGYTHDAQCVVYDGPDTRFTGRQICFAYNEDTLTIWDVTNKNSVTQLGRRTYSTARYTHQGWLTKDMKYVLLDDELDERDNPAVSFTTTYIVDVSVLTNPVFVNTFVHPEVSIDHNLYIWGAIHAKGWGGNPPMQNPPSAKYAYLSNYVAGIKILDIENPLSVREVGKFDVAPDLTGNVFEGTWSNYMHPSGNLAVASIDRGLFILKPKMAFDAVTNAPTPAPTNFPTPSPTLPPNSPPVNPTAQPTTAFPTPLPTPAPTTAFPTPAPTECEDKNPSGLVYSGTNNPAPCSEIGSYCEDLQIVRDACPATCGLCPSECADKVPSGLQYSNGQAAPCTDFISGGTYCTMYAVVQEACPRTCGICTVLTSFKGLVPVNTMLPSFIEDPNGAKSARDFLMGAKEAEWSNLKEEGKLPNSKVFSAINTPATCTNGQVIINGEVFTCDGIDFLSFMSLSDLFIQNIGGGGTTAGSDIWGWKSPISGKEVTIMCVDNGINFIDSTNPVSPIRMGFILSGRTPTSWCDVKVYQNTVYIVKDSGSPAQNYGIEVFDLLRLDNLTDAEMPFSFQPDFVYRQHGRSHNLAINTETGFLYSVGSNSCSSGLHMIDLANRLEPVFAGCASSDGYTHDAQCVIYRGPDLPHHGKEICFAFNEDTLTIWDVSVKATPTVLSRVSYNGFAYTHQGWLTKGMGYLLLDDELDERNGLVQTTRTHIWDVTVLTAPTRIGVYDHVDAAIDHNLYVWGEIHKYGWGGNPAMENPPSSNYAYLSNYVAGIRVLDICDVSTAKLTQKGFFDVSPDLTGNVFEGTWSNYMHPSGTLAVSSIDRGLFLLKPNMAFDSAECTVSTPTTPPTLPEEECVDTVPSGIKFNDGRPAECADIERFCSVYPVVQERCPLTCGSCGNPVCEDNVPSGLSYVDGTPAECSQIGIYCTVHSQVPVACPQTCGLCASNAKRVASFKGDSLISFVLDVGSEKKESNVLVVVTAILGVVCIGLATALLVSNRKKSVRSDKTEEAESFPEAQEVPLKVQMVKTNVAPTANPMFSEA